MDKNTLVGFVLIGAVIVGFGIYNRPSQEEKARAQHYQDSIQQLAIQKEQEALKAQEAAEKTIRLDSTSMFYQATQGTEQLTTLENDLLQLTFSNKGGRVKKAMLKEYMDQQKQPLVLFDGEDASLNFGFEGKNENLLSENLYFETVSKTDTSVTMRLNASNGGHLDFVYKLLPNSYMVDFSIQASGMQNFFSPSTKTVSVDWKQRARQMEKGYTFEQRYTSLTYKPVDDSFDYLSETKDEKETIPEVLDWVAFKNQYFSCVFIAEQNFEKATLESKMEQKGSGYMKSYQADMQTAFDPTGTKPSNFQFYFGPNHFKTLLASNDLSFKDKDLELEDLVYLGWPIIRLINRWFTINLSEHGYGNSADDHYREDSGAPDHLEVVYFVSQDACFETVCGQDQCQISQAGRCSEETAGNHGTLQPVWSQPDGWLLADAASDTGVHGTVLLCPECYRASSAEFPVGK